MSVSTYIDALTNEMITLDDETHGYRIDPPWEGYEVSHCEKLFFPGCSFINYSLDLIDALYGTLLDAGVVDGISLQCCGKILRFNKENAELSKTFRSKMIEALKALGVKEIILTCPNCYGEFKRFLEDDPETAKIVIKVAAEELLALGMSVSQDTLDTIGAFSIHDSCPDRKEGRFADSIREIMKAGDLHELEHIRKRSTCCGSSVRATGKEERAREIACSRARECNDADSKVLVTACMSCCYLLGSSQNEIPVYNYLELLFDKRVNWSQAPEHLTFRFMLGLA